MSNPPLALSDPTSDATPRERQLYQHLRAQQVPFQVYAHRPIFTVAEGMDLTTAIAGAHSKSLFLDDGAQFFLVTVPESRRVDIKALSRALGCGRLSFGKPARMESIIGVTPGSVTPLAVWQSAASPLTLVMAEALLTAPLLVCHPLRNDRSITLPPAAIPDLAAASGVPCRAVRDVFVAASDESFVTNPTA